MQALRPSTPAKPRVYYWNNIPSPYVVGRFNALARRNTLDFTAWFDCEREPDRSWDVDESQWEFPHRYLQSAEFGRARLAVVCGILREEKPDVLVSLYASTEYALASSYARSLGVRTMYRALPDLNTWQLERRVYKEIAKRCLFSAVDGVKVPGPDGRAFAERYGAERNRVFEVTQSIDVQHYSEALRIDRPKKERLRESLGLHGCVFLCVGRLLRGKGLETLIDAFATVQRQGEDVTLVIVGDGSDEVWVRGLAQNLRGVRFTGFVQPAELPNYYGIADVFVFPTLGDRNGVVVEEAMAAGLPVVSSTAIGDASRRVMTGVNGYLVPPGVSEPLAARMHELALNIHLRKKMGVAAHESALAWDHRVWARDFERAVVSLMETPQRSSACSSVMQCIGRTAAWSVR